MEALEHATKALVTSDLTAATTGISFERVSDLRARGTNQPNHANHRSSPTYRKKKAD
ncbi:hypothetical protein [Nonomuraea aridisoli]|uniref:hypothetical protein n=1 Tax=Nonomuraea aridisoli TaxID=2070368 RepID=UPI001C646E75|nr:hypothetical protein [Nonomuraea aridisoli]